MMITWTARDRQVVTEQDCISNFDYVKNTMLVFVKNKLTKIPDLSDFKASRGLL